MAEQGGGLVADLARAERLGNLGQRFQLLADTETIGYRGNRHTTEPAEPGDHTSAPISQVVATQLRRACLRRELTFEGINNDPQTLGIYPAVLSSQEPTHNFFDFGKACAPLPQHETSVSNICS